MRKMHAFSALVLLVAGSLLIGCAPAPAAETPITAEPTEAMTNEPTALPPTDVPPTHEATIEAVVTAEPTEPPREALFTLVGDAPMISHGSGWDASFAYPMSIVEQGGTFYLFRASTTPGSQATGYHTSTDLLNWTEGPNNPVLTSEALNDPDDMLLPWSIVQAEDGTWLMYFWSWAQSDSSDAWFGRATAEVLEGPWSLDEQRLLEPGAIEEWLTLYIQSPSVVARPEGGYAMLFEGSRGSQNLAEQGFGWATSEDGIEWVEHGPPVMRRGESGAWDSRFIQQPHMVHTPDGYVTVYEGGNSTGGGYGIATSTDGITWTRHPANPIFTGDDFPQAGFTHLSSLFYHDGTYYLLLELGTANGQATDIWLATHEGSILP